MTTPQIAATAPAHIDEEALRDDIATAIDHFHREMGSRPREIQPTQIAGSTVHLSHVHHFGRDGTEYWIWVAIDLDTMESRTIMKTPFFAWW